MQYDNTAIFTFVLVTSYKQYQFILLDLPAFSRAFGFYDFLILGEMSQLSDLRKNWNACIFEITQIYSLKKLD